MWVFVVLIGIVVLATYYIGIKEMIRFYKEEQADMFWIIAFCLVMSGGMFLIIINMALAN